MKVSHTYPYTKSIKVSHNWKNKKRTTRWPSRLNTGHVSRENEICFLRDVCIPLFIEAKLIHAKRYNQLKHCSLINK